MEEAVNNEQQVNTPETNYIDVINNMRDNTVAKTEYERVLADNKMLAQQLATTAPVSTEQQVEVLPTDEEITELQSKLFKQNNGLKNLEFISGMLELRNAIIKRGGRDPFLPVNKDYVENDFDADNVAEIAEGLQQIVDYADGNAELFNSELKRVCK